MLKSKKIRLKPTDEQEVLFFKSSGTARWTYNYFLSENERVYNEYLNSDKTSNRSISEGDVRKHIKKL